ncbi:hypothetical protein VTH06DRAFT_6261 [Thermothelomyces fergusii]
MMHHRRAAAVLAAPLPSAVPARRIRVLDATDYRTASLAGWVIGENSWAKESKKRRPGAVKAVVPADGDALPVWRYVWGGQQLDMEPGRWKVLLSWVAVQ